MNIQTKAFDIAYKAHLEQKYGDKAYICHIISTVINTKNLLGGDWIDNYDEYIATAYLHDVVEDTDVTLEDLLWSRIPKSVVTAVDAITKRDGETRKQYLLRVIENPIALIVKIADTEANLDASRKEGNGQRINKYEKQLEFLADHAQS
ncbi:hypothetical protein N9937_00290 [bacterium]|nr:hypothetical protein [bacterium]